MSYLLPHLHSGWAVDQAILAEEERLVVIRFGHDWDETCMQVMLCFFKFFSVSSSFFWFFYWLFILACILIYQTLSISVLMFLHGDLIAFVCRPEIRIWNLEAWVTWVHLIDSWFCIYRLKMGDIIVKCHTTCFGVLNLYLDFCGLFQFFLA